MPFQLEARAGWFGHGSLWHKLWRPSTQNRILTIRESINRTDLCEIILRSRRLLVERRTCPNGRLNIGLFTIRRYVHDPEDYAMARVRFV